MDRQTHPHCSVRRQGATKNHFSLRKKFSCSVRCKTSVPQSPEDALVKSAQHFVIWPITFHWRKTTMVLQGRVKQYPCLASLVPCSGASSNYSWRFSSSTSEWWHNTTLKTDEYPSAAQHSMHKIAQWSGLGPIHTGRAARRARRKRCTRDGIWLSNNRSVHTGCNAWCAMQCHLHGIGHNPICACTSWADDFLFTFHFCQCFLEK